MVNALRSHLSELGIIDAAGMGKVETLVAVRFHGCPLTCGSATPGGVGDGCGCPLMSSTVTYQTI